jgi:glycosyltransferase involved in cell wall biosynthesis
MKIAFFGVRSAFDYQEIGGTNSFVRRLTHQLLSDSLRGDQVDLIMYGTPRSITTSPGSGIQLFYYRSFAEAISALSRIIDQYDHVIAVYLSIPERLAFARFRARYHKRTRFHIIHFSWPGSILRRELMFCDNLLYYSTIYTISPRLFKAAQRWGLNSKLILPPVPDDYFVVPSEKPSSHKLRVAYIGRTEPGKGAQEIIELFSNLKQYPGIQTYIYGYHFPHHEPSVRMHEWLLTQKMLFYQYMDYERHSPHIEQQVKKILYETDVLLLPYKAISSTIDSPLLLLEGMAASCIVISKPLGDIPTLYGIQELLISSENWVNHTAQLIKGMKSNLQSMQNRVLQRTVQMDFRVSHIAKLFRTTLEAD